MATYVIGDVHGCFAELQLLLSEFNFNSKQDILWFTGDLVNGGPQSIETLQFIMDLQERAICVLGNHDLTLLGLASKKLVLSTTHTARFAKILTDIHTPKLINWLQSRKIMHYDPHFKVALVHAGLAPGWSINQALDLAAELETTLQNQRQAATFFANMFGNEPASWDDALVGIDRLRCITNYFTRLRFCSQDGND